MQLVSSLRRVIFCLALSIAVAMTWTSSASAAYAPLAPPRTMEVAQRQIEYWRNRALAAEAKHRLVAGQRDFARASFRTERSDGDALQAQLDTLRQQIAAAISALGGSAGLAEAIEAINATLGGTGSTLARAATAAASTDTSGADALAAEIADANAALGGSGSLDDRIVALNATLGGSGTTNARAANVGALLTSAPTSIKNSVDTLMASVGGPSATLQAQVTALSAQVLNTPTGVLRTDLLTLRNFILNTPSSTMQSDLGSIAAKLDSTSSGSTIEARIGAPQVNGISSSLTAVLGGSGSIADRIGDPIIASSGISALIGASATNANGFDVDPFNNATSVRDRLQATSDVFAQSNTIASANIILPVGPFSPLSAILSSLDHD